MAEGLNRVILLGNLGADPELKVTQGGTAVLKLRLATTERYVDRNGAKQERTEWHAISVWGKRGEALHKYLAKGSRILVEGSLRTSSYEDRDGNKRYRTDIIASNIVFADTGRSGREARGPMSSQDTRGEDMRGAFSDPMEPVHDSFDMSDRLPNDDDIPF